MRAKLLSRLSLLTLPLALVAGCESCDTPARTQSVPDDYTVVPGRPQVDTGKPSVEQKEPETPEFLINVPRQCDFFQQNAVRKVDILWVVDNSGSMKNAQATLTEEFPKFIKSLLSLDPPVDFHIGVTSTDTDNDLLVYNLDRDGPTLPPSRKGTRGELHGFDLTSVGGGVGNYIACDDKGTCNPPRPSTGSNADAVAAFKQMAKVGTGGSPVEKGLHAAYLALTRDDNQEKPGRPGFLRPDAALFLVFVSDEDDSSCSPFIPLDSTGRPASGEPCQADPGCRCARATDSPPPSWGTPQYFVRFLETYKGMGHEDLVAAGAVVCTDKKLVEAQNGDPGFQHYGCENDGTGTAYFGERYIAVAEGTGGTAISIRGSFSNALQSLGFAVSGLRKDFRLTRGPFTDTLEAYMSVPVNRTCQRNADCLSPAYCDGTECTIDCKNDSDCQSPGRCRANKCALPLTVGLKSFQGCPSSDDPSAPNLAYCKCDTGLFRNILRFKTEPPAHASIEVCYDVNSNFNRTCQ